MINGLWLSINEYSEYRDISISTIRRYIKAKRVQYKLENRRYFIYVSREQYERRNSIQKIPTLQDRELILEQKVTALEQKIKNIMVDNSELKMLVDLYEGKQQKPQQLPPDIPLIC